MEDFFIYRYNYKEELMKNFYLTTPIYYPSDNLHIGHTYTTVAADVLKRFKKKQGYNVFFTTGTDEHGQKMAEAAKKAGKTPKEYVDLIVDSIKDLWSTLEIDYDKFIRTTDDFHGKVVQDIFVRLYEKGEIYKDNYEGNYCVPCESFWSDSQLVDGKCPDCGRPVEKKEEESYFFRLSKYTDRILKLYEDNPHFIQPESRMKEMVNNFLKEGLEDLSVTRSSLEWGVKVPFDEKHVIYVWIDALSCYLTALGYGTENDKNFREYWPANVHLVGKEIVRFHTIIWPAILMALDLPLPEKVFAHGWILFEDDKMSKSKGNIIYPEPIIELFGIDAFKYFLMREFSFGQDGSFSKKKFLQRLNSDLANDLGNLVSRTTAMIDKYNDSVVVEPKLVEDVDSELKEVAVTTLSRVEAQMENYAFSDALEEIWKLIRRTNKYIDETAPWILAKENKDRLDTVLYNLAESLRIVSILIDPFMKKTSLEIRKQLGLAAENNWEDASKWGILEVGTRVERGEAIFPRLDLEKDLKRLDEANDKLVKERIKAKEKKTEEDLITIDEFDKMKLKVAEILSCENHPNADKLYVFKLRLGSEERQIVSGIKKWYKPEDLVGKKVVVITNLQPIKLRGVESNGMILAAEDDEENLTLLSTLEDIKSGSTIS